MPLILDYAPPRPKQYGWPKAPAWVAPASLTPLFLWPTWPVLIQRVDHWLKLAIGQGWERLTGMLWIASVVLSLVWIGYYWLRPKPWYVRCCLGLHGLFIAATILPPGCIMLAWLMHWLTGPGA